MSRSEKTKLGIAKARSRGVVWGRHGAVLAVRNRQEAREFAEKLVPLLLQLEEARSLRLPRLGPRRLARKLNELGVPGRNGGVWHPVTVARLLKRLGPAFEEERKRIRAAKFNKAIGAKSK